MQTCEVCEEGVDCNLNCWKAPAHLHGSNNREAVEQGSEHNVQAPTENQVAHSHLQSRTKVQSPFTEPII